ncbi:hypothetical protein [Brucella anthropi]|uniref:hypothetical protein n=1 Tax=Brucella anthropi TaxID=529 RepID=UPI001F24C164|nr:hypothetical protein [Brucella anthropi]
MIGFTGDKTTFQLRIAINLDVETALACMNAGLFGDDCGIALGCLIRAGDAAACLSLSVLPTLPLTLTCLALAVDVSSWLSMFRSPPMSAITVSPETVAPLRDFPVPSYTIIRL